MELRACLTPDMLQVPFHISRDFEQQEQMKGHRIRGAGMWNTCSGVVELHQWEAARLEKLRSIHAVIALRHPWLFEMD